MAAYRQRMNDALKLKVVPYLREHGFKGSLPHFRRIGASKTDVITFQFDKWGGGFIIELGRVPTDDVLVMPWGKEVPAAKLTTYMLADRVRLGADPTGKDEKWFRYDDHTEAACEVTADEILKLLPQAVKWWQGERSQPNIRQFA